MLGHFLALTTNTKRMYLEIFYIGFNRAVLMYDSSKEVSVFGLLGWHDLKRILFMYCM